MRNLISLIAIILLFGLAANAAAEAGRGMINLVNMIPGNSRCMVKIDGVKLLPDGMMAGAETGWFLLPAGEKNLEFEHEGARDLSVGLTLEEGEGIVLAIYLEFSRQRKKDGKLAAPMIRMKRFPVYDNEESCMKAVSLCKSEKIFEIGGGDFVLQPADIVELPKWAGAGFHIKYKGRAVGEIRHNRQRSNYYVFIAPAGHGNYFAAKANCDQLGFRR
ncbi:hypothetical protein ACFSSA_01880 [Luteolibacter algae]|uniref:Uncharacterized protein n=1 Tax=Luteolibacter algae TaxID=454151 RepID=A0ABW5D2Y5_9BACT